MLPTVTTFDDEAPDLVANLVESLGPEIAASLDDVIRRLRMDARPRHISLGVLTEDWGVCSKLPLDKIDAGLAVGNRVLDLVGAPADPYERLLKLIDWATADDDSAQAKALREAAFSAILAQTLADQPDVLPRLHDAADAGRVAMLIVVAGWGGEECIDAEFGSTPAMTEIEIAEAEQAEISSRAGGGLH